MKVSFPRMGYSYLAFRWLFEEIGHECIVPPEPNNETLDLGVRHSPEFACIPFKVLMGTYLQVAAQGAEIIVTSGGCGPCRAGLYWMMHQKILDEIGAQVKVFAFEDPMANIPDFYRKLEYLRKNGRATRRHFIRAVQTGWEKVKAMDELEILSHRLRPYESEKGNIGKAMQFSLNLIDQANDKKEVEKARQEGLQILNDVLRDDTRDPLKVGIIGEIYVLLEPSINQYMQSTLGDMGVISERSIYLSAYAQENVFVQGEKDVRMAARPYLNEFCIGGHGVNSIGETVLYAQHGFDGVIQLAPFSCIPEIVARSILPRVSRELDIPVLTFFLDEQTSKAGMETRLEAFIDLMEKRRVHKRNLKGVSLITLPAGRTETSDPPQLSMVIDK